MAKYSKDPRLHHVVVAPFAVNHLSQARVGAVARNAVPFASIFVQYWALISCALANLGFAPAKSAAASKLIGTTSSRLRLFQQIHLSEHTTPVYHMLCIFSELCTQRSLVPAPAGQAPRTSLASRWSPRQQDTVTRVDCWIGRQSGAKCCNLNDSHCTSPHRIATASTVAHFNLA